MRRRGQNPGVPRIRARILRFIGAAAQLREQALPLIFRIDMRGEAPQAAPAILAVNQPVRVAVQTGTKQKAIALPAAALGKNASNENIVWVHTAAEQFAPRTVRVAPLDGARIAVTAGLKEGERVVIDGAQLIGQVR